MACRFHYQEYLVICKEKSIKPKVLPPKGWKPDDRCVGILILDMIVTSRRTSRMQKTLDGFTVMVEKALPVTKASLKEFCLELIVDADLVSLSSYFQHWIELSFFQSFRFMDRPSFRRLLLYTSPKLTDSEIPKRGCIGNAVMEKLTKLDEIDKKLISICAYFYI